MKTKRIVLVLLFSTITIALNGQIKSNLFLLGYATFTDQYTTSQKGTIDYISGNANVMPAMRKMKFMETQANISDSTGNLLMSSNGVWIANATGDTMMNGAGLNPGAFTTNWSNAIGCLPVIAGNVMIPFPGDPTKYILFHMTANYNLNLSASEIYYSVIDMTMDGGLGGVTLKNQIAVQDTFAWGIGACKHANGRDWWIIGIKDNSNIIYKILITPNGIESITTQSIGTSVIFIQAASQPVFSPNGIKFAYMTAVGPAPWVNHVNYLSFDRCSGNFSNYLSIPVNDGNPAIGLMFSSNSKYLYGSTTKHILQFNTDTTDIIASADTVATNDLFYSPVPPFRTNFYLMYRADDGKIYLTSTNGILDLHYINYPDNQGMACDVHLHDLHLPCYHVGSVPNHPNYFLGAETGSICDSLTVGMNEATASNQLTLKVFPNPITGQSFGITYTLEQNKKGKLEVVNTDGKIIYMQNLPQWSTVQRINVSSLNHGIYLLRLTSGKSVATTKMVVVEE